MSSHEAIAYFTRDFVGIQLYVFDKFPHCVRFPDQTFEQRAYMRTTVCDLVRDRFGPDAIISSSNGQWKVSETGRWTLDGDGMGIRFRDEKDAIFLKLMAQ